MTELPALAGLWELSQEGSSASVEMQLPGDGITALHDAGVIPDPYWGRNELDLRWIADAGWRVCRSVDLARTDLSLVISGLDTVAEIIVNGQSVLKAQNSFRSYRIDLSKALKLGENRFEILFPPVLRDAEAKQASMPFFVPYHSENSPLANGNMLRKPQCDFGWDWNLALAPFGVTGGLELRPLQDPRFENVAVQQEHNEGSVTLTLQGNLVDTDADEVTLDLCDRSVTKAVEPGSGTFKCVLTLDNPELWWPAGQGAQVLHDLHLRAGEASVTRRIGLCDIRLVSEEDTAGRSFGFQVNGRSVFAKGANWIPADALAGRITREAVADLLQSAVAANMNMIRVWGGGRYEPDWFYDLCDELGLMVWQDFMFACNLYPSTPDFLKEVTAEVRENVARLQHHACIALWCGDNELIGALNWFEESREDRDRYLVSYDRLNRTIETALLETDPCANWWPSSPSPGPMAFGDAWHDDGAGDMHFWSVWHEGRDMEHYRDVTPRFCSEFGFQSYPSMDVIARFADPADFNIAAPVMEHHQKNLGGNARIAETMFRYFRFPVDFESFVYLSQVQQALAIKTAVSFWRSTAPHCQGTLIWQLNDTWPVCSWSSIDHGGGWKLLHYLARHFYAPVAVTVVPQEGGYRINGVNDTGADIDLRLDLRAVTLSGESRDLPGCTAMLPAGKAVDVAVLALQDLKADEVLVLDWNNARTGNGSEVFVPRRFKTYTLPDPGLSMDVQRDGADYVLTIRSKAIAFHVAVTASVPGRLSDNGMTVLPGTPLRLQFTPQDPKTTPTFSLRDLWSATHGPVV